MTLSRDFLLFFFGTAARAAFNSLLSGGPNEDRLVAMGHPCAHRAIRQIRMIRPIRVSFVDASGAAE
jgi:hypothetical protein